jgi:prepilin-type N-terminal cleavage/methylation domain-containing protein
MNPRGRSSGHRRRAFTLIELLVVLVIIGILAALIYSTLDASYVPRKKAVARAQLQQIATAINVYHAKLGVYPPDNPNNPAMNQLYFELLGTTNNSTAKQGATNWVTLDHSAQISSIDLNLNIKSVFGVTGFANTSPRAHSDDQSPAATSFLDNLQPNQVGSIDPINSPHIKVLVCSAIASPSVIPSTQLNPWCYNSSHPVSNPGSYDLWVDIVVRGKTYRIGNWNQ